MKKEYETPKAEKMEFDYSEAVVASGTPKCKNSTLYSEDNTVEGEKCTSAADDTVYAEGFY